MLYQPIVEKLRILKLKVQTHNIYNFELNWTYIQIKEWKPQIITKLNIIFMIVKHVNKKFKFWKKEFFKIGIGNLILVQLYLEKG